MKTKLIINKDGSRVWFLDHKLNRYGGAASEWNNGSKNWYKNDKFHRIQGPAFEYIGAEGWFIEGKLL